MGKLISLSTMREIQVPQVQIGQLVRYTGDMANPSGLGAVIEDTGNEYGRYTVALDDGREIRGTNLDSSRWHIRPGIIPIERLQELKATVFAKKATDQAAKTSANQEFENTKARIKEFNKHLDTTEPSPLIRAAKNIRIELKRAFPSVKFNVRTKRFSGGNDLRVEWTDGPTVSQVEAIADKYSGGTFDGMTDSYSYKHSPWVEVFGDAKYVFCERNYSDKVIESCIRRVFNHLGGLDVCPTVEDYRKGRIHYLQTSGGCDFGRELNISMSKHTCCINKAD